MKDEAPIQQVLHGCYAGSQKVLSLLCLLQGRGFSPLGQDFGLISVYLECLGECEETENKTSPSTGWGDLLMGVSRSEAVTPVFLSCGHLERDDY